MQTKWRRAQVDDDLRALLDQAAHRFDVVKRPRQIMLRPNIFAKRHANFLAAQIKWFNVAGRFKITIFVKHVVGWQERLMGFADGFAALE